MGLRTVLTVQKPKKATPIQRSKLHIGDHAQASSTTLRIIMSEILAIVWNFFRQAQVAACEKLRDTVTGISALHKSLHEKDGRSPSPRNSFPEL
ncbi:hypothetical protein TNCV_564061 [Trichonephila clavipes]|nr:hypothetical protein TNCV_564061 [Trichonephila clavipes]